MGILTEAARALANHPLVGGGFVVCPDDEGITIYHECTTPDADLIAGPAIGAGETLTAAIENSLQALTPADRGGRS